MTIRVWPQAVASARVAHVTCQPHPCCHRVSLNSRAVRAVNLHDETALCASVIIDCTYHGLHKCSFAVLHTTVSTISAPLTIMECVVRRNLGTRQHQRCRRRDRRRTWPHSTALEHGGTARLFWTSAANMRGRAPLLRTCLCSTPWDPGALSRRLGAVRLKCEHLRSARCNLWLRAEPTDHVRHHSCADDTVRLPYPSELPGTQSTVDGAPWSLSGTTLGECVCGPPSKVAQLRPRGAPSVPTGYTLCRSAVGEAAHGHRKHPRATPQKRR